VEIELQEIRDYVANVPPFDLLPENTLNRLVQNLGIRYLRRGKSLPVEQDDSPMLYIIRQGAISLFSPEKELLGKLAEGDIFSSIGMSDDETPHTSVIEDTLVYSISCAALFDIAKDTPELKDFILQSPHRRLSDAIKSTQQKASQSATLMNTSLESLVNDVVVDIDINSSIHQASLKMTEQGVSSLLVTEVGKLEGIITDRDIRSRCVAEGLATDSSVKQIMTHDPVHVGSSTIAFDALMLMTKKNIHHLPVVDDGRVRGIITATDLMRYEGKNAVHISRAIFRAESLEVLAEISQMIPQLQQQMLVSGGSAEHVGKAVTAVSDALTRRLIEMAEEKFGPPPVAYAWVAAGSQARFEQSSHSDQDNGLIISDDMKSEHATWFSELADFVCDGLDACGFIHCPGDAMAKNPQWRQTETIWTGYYKKWINTPEPKALMLSSIFFDVRVVRGDKSLLRNIQKIILPMTKNNQLFLAHMTANSLQHKTPLGFFRDFVLVDEAEHKDTLDLKHNGIVPIIDIARIYALAEGLKTVNTQERLKQAAGSPSLSKDGAENLLDAFEFISDLRMEHQAEQIRKGEAADNFLPPKSLSRLQRAHLKDAFKVVQVMQESLSHRYHVEHF
jgi:CBS domain-containing protein